MDMIERVARAIGAIEDPDSERWKSFLPDAISAIEAMREPTPAQVDAGVKHHPWSIYKDTRGIYTAMIDAALGDSK